MLERVNEEEVLKNTKFMVFNLLRILKFFYSFKELEKRLNVPSQVLWRYVTLRVTPEKKTAQRILTTIRKHRLIEEVVYNTVFRSKELWTLTSNPGILELAALRLADELKKSKIDVVLSTPDPYSAALAAIVSTYLRAKLCIPSHTPLSDNVLAESYQVASGVLGIAAIPRECVPKKSRVLIVTLAAVNPFHLKAAMNLAMKRQAIVSGIFSLIGASQTIQEILENFKPEHKPQVIVLLETDANNRQHA